MKRARLGRQSVLVALIASIGLAGSWLVMPPLAAAATDVIGNIPVSTTWSKAAGPYKLTGDVKVLGLATLTIEPGVEVVYSATDALGANESPTGVELIVKGRLDVLGTVDEPVRFTGAGGNSVGIRLDTSAKASTIEHAVFSSFAYAIEIRDAEARELRHIRVESSSYGIVHQGSGPLTVTDSLVSCSARGLWFPASPVADVLIAGSVFESPAGSFVIGEETRLEFADQGDASLLSAGHLYRTYNASATYQEARKWCLRRAADLAGFETRDAALDFVTALKGYDGSGCNCDGGGCGSAYLETSFVWPWMGLSERHGPRARDQFVDGSQPWWAEVDLLAPGSDAFEVKKVAAWEQDDKLAGCGGEHGGRVLAVSCGAEPDPFVTGWQTLPQP